MEGEGVDIALPDLKLSLRDATAAASGLILSQSGPAIVRGFSDTCFSKAFLLVERSTPPTNTRLIWPHEFTPQTG